MTPYELEQRPFDGSYTVVHIAGELDLTNAEDVEQRLETLPVNGSDAVVLDLNRVLFIDSAALHVLFKTARRLGRERLVLVLDGDAGIARTLAIVGMAEMATIVGSFDDLSALERG